MSLQLDKQKRSEHQIQLVVHIQVHELMFFLSVQFFRPKHPMFIREKQSNSHTSMSEIADLSVHDQLTKRVER